MFLLQKVTNIDFSWVSPRPDEVPGLANGSHAAGSNVMITFSKRSVFFKINKDFEEWPCFKITF